MTCTRCHGLMIVDAFIDMDDNSGQLWMGAARCVNCGEVIDLGIAHNRAAHPARIPACRPRRNARRPRSRPLYPVRLTA
ncbi:MAG: hypothetical protein ACREJ6_09830 [Candidatus Methylomirabilis sp.]